MGMFDEVRVPCPKCGKVVHFQSKGGDCNLTTYELSNAPLEVMGDINRHPGHCPECDTWFRVDVQILARSVEINPVDSIEDDHSSGFSWRDGDSLSDDE